MSGSPATFDVHTHAVVPGTDELLAGQPGHLAQQERDSRWFGAAAGAANQAQLTRLKPLLTDLDARLSHMDTSRVDAQLVAPMPLYHAWADPRLADQLVQTTNEGIATLVQQRPDRLVGAGTVSLQHPDLAVQQLAYAVDQLGLRALQIGTTAGDLELDNPALADFWACAEETSTFIVIHPWGCSLGERLADYYLGNTVGNPVETTVALSRLIFSGLLDRHPGLEICLVHGGGYLPTYLGRSDHAWSVRPDAHGCAELPSAYLRRLRFDSLVYTPAALTALVDSAGADRILLGSDYPFDMGVPDPVDRLKEAGLDVTSTAAIAGGNASALGLTPTPQPAPELSQPAGATP